MRVHFRPQHWLLCHFGLYYLTLGLLQGAVINHKEGPVRNCSPNTKRNNEKYIDCYYHNQELRWAGHVVRMPMSLAPRHFLTTLLEDMLG